MDQIIFEFRVVGAHAVEVLGQFERGEHVPGHIGRPANDFFDFVGELRGVGGFDDDGRCVTERFEGVPIKEALPRDGAVGFEEKLKFIPEITHTGDGAGVVDRRGKEVASHCGQIGLAMNFAGFVHLATIDRDEAGKVARVADVHGV